jgi:RNA-directed DNA polymerase
MTHHRTPQLKIGRKSLERMKAKVRDISRKGRGRNIRRVIEELTPILRGWSNYFKLSEVKKPFEELDGWIRRKRRCIMWRQWKRSFTRARKLIPRGISVGKRYKQARPLVEFRSLAHESSL